MSAPEEIDFNQTMELVVAAQDGDERALGDLFDRYLPRIERIVSLRMGRKLATFVDSDDVVQETLRKLFQSLDQFEQRTEGSFRNWVATCVEREVVNFERKRVAKKRGGGNVVRMGDRDDSTSVLSGIFAGKDRTPSSIIAQRELEENLEAALLELKPHHRELVIQRYLCEMSYAEIAANLQVDESTVRKACTRTVEKLKGLIGR